MNQLKNESTHGFLIMKKQFFLFLAALLLVQDISFANPAFALNTETQSQHESKTPDFSPPKDLSGPVFPQEDLFGKPTQDTSRFLTEFINMMATLGLIISLILIIAWFLKRMVNAKQEQANATSLIKVVERRSISPKTAIYFLEIEGKSLIISESQHGVTRLAEYESIAAEETKKIPSAFNQILDNDREDR